jgi:hypothetical protein
VPQLMEWLYAIGKFHLGAHIKSCNWKYTLNFISGACQIEGEIMETLWALFNNFGRMCRSMGSNHRKEILNDHMRDVNWKKMVGMGLFHYTDKYTPETYQILAVTMLRKKLKNAKRQSQITKKSFDELSTSLDENARKKWYKKEAAALKEGGDALRIYDIRLDKGQFSGFATINLLTQNMLAPSQASIRLKLAEAEAANHLDSGTISWLSTGLDIEHSQ